MAMLNNQRVHHFVHRCVLGTALAESPSPARSRAPPRRCDQSVRARKRLPKPGRWQVWNPWPVGFYTLSIFKYHIVYIYIYHRCIYNIQMYIYIYNIHTIYTYIYIYTYIHIRVYIYICNTYVYIHIFHIHNTIYISRHLPWYIYIYNVPYIPYDQCSKPCVIPVYWWLHARLDSYACRLGVG